MIIGREIKKIVGLDDIDGIEHFAVIWSKPGNELEIEGDEVLKGPYRVVGVVIAPITKKGKKKKVDKGKKVE